MKHFGLTPPHKKRSIVNLEVSFKNFIPKYDGVQRNNKINYVPQGSLGLIEEWHLMGHGKLWELRHFSQGVYIHHMGIYCPTEMKSQKVQWACMHKPLGYV